MLDLNDGERWIGAARPIDRLGVDALDYWLAEGTDIIQDLDAAA